MYNNNTNLSLHLQQIFLIMTQISSRAIQMPESPIRKLIPSADIARKKGNKVYHLNIGQPDIHSPQSAIETLKNWNTVILSYTRSEGSEMYRKALEQYYQNCGHKDITQDNFMVTNGGSEALTVVLNLICNAQDEIIIPEPFYANYNGFSIQSEIKIVPVSTHIEEGFALPSIAKLEQKITPKTKAILICHPGNPTGNMYSKKELERLKDLVIRHDLFLISDEVYREFCYNQSFISVLDFPELKNHAIIIDSESKRFSLCGIRLGAIVSRNQEVLQMALKYAQARLCPNIISQVVAAQAHQNSIEFLKKSKEEYLRRRDYMVAALNQIPGVYCPQPQGAFYCAVKLPVKDSEHFSKWILEEFDYQGETIMLAPMQGFYSTPEMGKNEVRIAYVLKIGDLEKSIKILEKALEVYPDKI